MCTIALLFCSAETALQCESHHSSFRDFISLSLCFSGEDCDTLVSVSWVVPVTVPDKLHVTRKWRLLALIERMSFSVAWRAHLYSVSATHDQCVQMKLSCSSATTDVVWTEQREKDEQSSKITMSLLDLLCSLSCSLYHPSFFPSH